MILLFTFSEKLWVWIIRSLTDHVRCFSSMPFLFIFLANYDISNCHSWVAISTFDIFLLVLCLQAWCYGWFNMWMTLQHAKVWILSFLLAQWLQNKSDGSWDDKQGRKEDRKYDFSPICGKILNRIPLRASKNLIKQYEITFFFSVDLLATRRREIKWIKGHCFIFKAHEPKQCHV